MPDSTATANVADSKAAAQHAALSLNTSPHAVRRSSTPYYGGGGYGGTNRCLIAVIVYLALFLDNVLLTVIVPILPDYLAFINNRTFYTRMSAGHGFGNIGLGGVGTGALLAYHSHNLNNSSSYAASQPPMQTILSKHPIPGKSMVNFSVHNSNDDKIAAAAAATLSAHDTPQQLQQQKQQYIMLNGNGNLTDIVKIVTSGRQFHLSHNATSAAQPNVTPLPLSLGNRKTDERQPQQQHQQNTINESLADENGSIGLLLAMKALVQLVFNPIVGNFSTKYGYRLPIVMGTFFLLMSSLVFAVGETYITLLLARAIQGIGSACIGVCGMSLVAQHYPEEDRRSKVMGVILGSIALGVLIGYPFGGFLYDMVGKSAPFIILSTIIFLNLGMQLIVMDLSVQPEVIIDSEQQQQPKWKPLLESKMILAIIVAIWFSTSTMAMLEPCLPIWLMQYLRPTKWQLGTVFIPDSVGYFVGTNFFGSIAYKYGQIKISCISLLLVGISSILIPSARSVAQLLLPHFCLGLGIGIIDAALVPLLATFVDATLMQEDPNDMEGNGGSSGGGTGSMSSYGTVYCLQQTSVSLAYCLAPLIGGELAEAFGFTWLMRIVGIFNIVYGPVLVYLYQKYDPKSLREKHNEMLLINTDRGGSQYKQLYNSMDAE